MVFHDTLSNGIRVIGEPMEHFRSVSMGVWVGTGSVAETGSENGMSHFIEHMVFKGTERRTAADIAAEMDSLGGNINAFTAKECTCFYAKVLDEHMPEMVDVLSDIVRFSRFDKADIEREKGVVCEEILMTDDSPEDVAHETLMMLMYAGEPLESPILGTEKTVRAFTREGILAYMDRHYLPSNTVIACAGSFEREALMKELEHRFASDMRGSRRALPKSALVGGKHFKAVKKDIEQVHICLGLPGCPMESDEKYALLVLSNIIGGSTSSRLFQSIREERGLAYSVYSYPSPYMGTGYFALYAGTGEKQGTDVTKLMLDELRKIRREGVTEEELVRGREQLKGSYILGQESTSARSNAIGKAELFGQKVHTDDEVLSFIEAVDMEKIRASIEKLTDFSALSASVVGRTDKVAPEIEKLVREA